MARAMVGYTTNESWYWALYTKLYFDEDNYRATVAYADVSVNFRFYDEVSAGGFIDFNSLHHFVFFGMQGGVFVSSQHLM